MWSSRCLSFAALLAASVASAEPGGYKKPPVCPTVVSTQTICSTCVIPDCVTVSTISNPSDCPAHVATKTTKYPCNYGSCPGGCGTQYVYPSSYSVPSYPSPSSPSSQTYYTPTTSSQQTYYTPSTPTYHTPSTSSQQTYYTPSTSSQQTYYTPSTSSQQTYYTPSTSSQQTYYTPSTSSQQTYYTPSTSSQQTYYTPSTPSQQTYSTPSTYNTPSSPTTPSQQTYPSVTTPTLVTYPGTTQPGCPTITSTRSLCSTCIRPQCLFLETVSWQCGCPAEIPTVYVDYPCYGPTSCPGGCGTEYTIATVTPDCYTSPTVPVPSCVPTVTYTEHPGYGCRHKCKEAPCITDIVETLPCGCSTYDSVYTETTTVCAPKHCKTCQTGYQFVTATEGCGYPPPQPTYYTS